MKKRILIGLSSLILLTGASARASDAEPKAVLHVRALQMPGDEVSFQRDGVEITRLHCTGPKVKRPYLFPVNGPSGKSLTLLNGPNVEAHHQSLWLSHPKINGEDFWTNEGKGRIIHKKLESLSDGETSASVTTLNHWVDTAKDKTLLVERRRYTVQVLDKGEWLLLIDSQFEAATDVTFGQAQSGFLGIHPVATIATKGGGSNRTSNGDSNVTGVLTKGAKWAGYSGRATPDSKVVEGITVFDHPKNPNHPTPFKIKNWMSTSITTAVPIELPKGKTLRLRYGVYIHSDQTATALDARWQAFAKDDLDELTPPK